jgi:hypothetical protein
MTVRFNALTDRVAASIQSRVASATEGPEAGMSTAEYAVGTVAAVGLAAILFKLITGPKMEGMIGKMIISAITGAVKHIV